MQSRLCLQVKHFNLLGICTIQNKSKFGKNSYFQWLELGHLLIHPVYTQSPILAWLLLALVYVDFASVSLETGQAGASEATNVVMATAAIETWLWLTLVNLDLTSGPCEHQSRTDVRGRVRLRCRGQKWTRLSCVLAVIMCGSRFNLTERILQLFAVPQTAHCVQYICNPALKIMFYLLVTWEKDDEKV